MLCVVLSSQCSLVPEQVCIGNRLISDVREGVLHARLNNRVASTAPRLQGLQSGRELQRDILLLGILVVLHIIVHVPV